MDIIWILANCIYYLVTLFGQPLKQPIDITV
jgi:hypothetical protein